ncbi:MAG: LytTR family DNA-binding domain-containing protein [Nitratireductor sp.]
MKTNWAPALARRVHRSWWVAAAHASRLERGDGRMELILSNGTSVPVSRSYREAAQVNTGPVRAREHVTAALP